MNPVTVVRDGERVTVALHGALDMQTVPRIAARVDEQVRGSASSHLTLDLGDVQFIDSSGLALLVDFRNESRAGHFTLSLRHVPNRALRLLDITALSPHFDIE